MAKRNQKRTSKDAPARKEAAARDDWRAKTLDRLRQVIMEALPGGAIVEEIKWRKPSNPAGVPVWSHRGIICTGEIYKEKVKLTFARGAAVEDPAGLFNAGLDGNARRAIDIREEDRINEAALRKLVRAAAALNAGRSPKGGMTKGAAAKTTAKRATSKPKLLSGGNPQIPKGEGNGPVRAYIAAMPGWKRDIGRRLDALIVKTVPGVRKAVKWNSPFYGAGEPDNGWFLSFHCFTRYVKVTFLRGSSLRPVPPGESKHKDVRYLDIHEGWTDAKGELIDEGQFTKWVKQASRLPGERM